MSLDTISTEDEQSQRSDDEEGVFEQGGGEVLAPIAAVIERDGRLDYLFNNGVRPDPLDRAEINNDGSINVADVVTLLEFLFNMGPPPPAPFPDPGCP